jgi:hypothetical protein
MMMMIDVVVAEVAAAIGLELLLCRWRAALTKPLEACYSPALMSQLAHRPYYEAVTRGCRASQDRARRHTDDIFIFDNACWSRGRAGEHG